MHRLGHPLCSDLSSFMRTLSDSGSLEILAYTREVPLYPRYSLMFSGVLEEGFRAGYRL